MAARHHHRPGELTGDAGDYRVHSWAFTFDTAAADLDDGGLDVGTKTIVKTDPAARAFNVLDNVLTARSYYHTLPGVETPG